MPEYLSHYRDVLEAVQTRIGTLIADEDSALAGWGLALRKEPAFVPAQDRLPQLVMSGNRTLGAIPVRHTFGNVVQLGFEVIVGNFVDARWDLTQLWRRAAAMQALQFGLWDVGLAESIDGGFDPDYQPAFFEGAAAPANIDGNWMKFTYRLKSQRTTGR